MDHIACRLALARVKEDLMVAVNRSEVGLDWRLAKISPRKKSTRYTFQRLMSRALLSLQG